MWPDVVAVDWSGAKSPSAQRRKIWLAEADVASGSVRRLECGRTRDEVVAQLVGLDRPVLVGLDFAFSFPAWFVKTQAAATAPAFWRTVHAHGEGWLDTGPLFWGRKGRCRPACLAHDRGLRRTEREYRGSGGAAPKSAFQIGGAGAVGTGSLRGIPHLLDLQDGGFAVWPFQEPGPRTVVEIYPRWFTGPVKKSDAQARRRHLARFTDRLTSPMVHDATASDDAFDAVVSALEMTDAVAAGRRPRPVAAGDGTTRLEGRIWLPEFERRRED